MKFFFGSNLKMNQSPGESAAFVAELDAWAAANHAGERPCQLWAALSHTNLTTGLAQRRSPALWVGAQNVHWADSGAFTGEISARQLAACGVDFVLIGHAERRLLNGETDLQVGQKVAACERAGLRIILCVGETRDAFERGEGSNFVQGQLAQALQDYRTPEKLLVLYEPVWAIGERGQAADLPYVNRALENVSAFLEERYLGFGERVPVMYGGSVTLANAPAYVSLAHCAGLGVGRAAWAAADYLNVLARCRPTNCTVQA